MSKSNAAASRDSRPQEPTQDAKPRLWIKLLASALILLHLTAVFAAPFAVAGNVGGSSSPFADAIRTPLWPYIVALYLDHGYFFFAPNPGPNHLIEYKVEFDDGRPPVQSRIPDLKTERPRLLYHRHFMLSEALNNSYAPPEPPPEPSPPPLTASSQERARFQIEQEIYKELHANWQRRRRQYESMRKSIEDHLLHAHGGSRVTIQRIEHRPPLPVEFTTGRLLSAPESYVVMPESSPRGESR